MSGSYDVEVYPWAAWRLRAILPSSFCFDDYAFIHVDWKSRNKLCLSHNAGNLNMTQVVVQELERRGMVRRSKHESTDKWHKKIPDWDGPFGWALVGDKRVGLKPLSPDDRLRKKCGRELAGMRWLAAALFGET